MSSNIFVAMSGGVDSSAAAALLKEKHPYAKISGITMLLDGKYNEHIKDAEAAAEKLNIDLHIVDLSKEFERTVKQQFIDAYASGKTPNPCVTCNKEIKFGLLHKKAKELGADLIATGHYARIVRNGKGFELHKSHDSKKDQSYFLSAISKEQLTSSLFPLSDLTKEEVRELAAKYNLPAARKIDSQDICFIPDGDYKSFLKENACSKCLHNAFSKGEIVHCDGRVVGKHEGLAKYTVGQRRGLNIGGGEILYVVKLDTENNQVIVGAREDLLCSKIFLEDINWLGHGDTPPNKIQCKIKFRYRQTETSATVYVSSNEIYTIPDEPVAGISPGQRATFYDGDRVIGGAWIT
ncbi:MAG: tRNA 2-thiouridine(34) synthase MnmA [Alphaproteobacteria bacterium]|nr:tRNA 2-thiouridine(34) synthase MnmA [Alphaproteobacteria bacterium]